MYYFEADDLSISEPLWSCELSGNPCSCIDISKDDLLISYSNFPGTLFIVNFEDGSKKYTVEQSYSNAQVVSCKFNPSAENTIIYACRDGFIFIYDMFDMKISAMARHLGTALLNLAVDGYGETFTIACQDGSLRIYDLKSMKRTSALVKLSAQTNVLGSAIYDIVYHPSNSNIILSATGKDSVLIWDIRSGNVERTILGPHIRGNGLDIHDNTVLTASYRESKQIEMWDFRNGQKIKEITLDSRNGHKNGTFLSTIRVAYNGFDYVVSGSEMYSAYIYNFRKSNLIGQTSIFKDKVSSCCISPSGTTIVTGSEAGTVNCQIIRVKETNCA